MNEKYDRVRVVRRQNGVPIPTTQLLFCMGRKFSRQNLPTPTLSETTTMEGGLPNRALQQHKGIFVTTEAGVEVIPNTKRLTFLYVIHFGFFPLCRKPYNNF